MTTVIKCQIIGSDRCTYTAGPNERTSLTFTVRSGAPVLAMCRKLIEAGYDPARPLHAYRGDTLCLKIRSLHDGAMLECQDGGGFRLRAQRKDAQDDGETTQAAE